jgi:aspartyl-tRNA(Asn)/glutamyl-tRNA(Gln) amidotransferase subunit A
MELHRLSLHEARALLDSRRVTSTELTRAVLDHVRRTDAALGAFVTLCEEKALAQAAEADRRIENGENVTPVTGIPYSAKDALSTRGVRTTCSSRILSNYTPIYSATVIDRLADAGAVLIGKTNMDEFGMGSSCENSAVCATRNPWDLKRVPGGSSGGGAAAVAAHMGPFSLGEDTGGSVRMPASFCGVTGLKPSYGRVSRYGLLALVSSFDSIGPFARDVRDCAHVMQVIAGRDPRDSTTLGGPVPNYAAELEQGVKGLTLGIPREYFGEGLDAGVEKTVREAIAHLESLGARTVEVSLPHSKYAIPVYYLILFAEASSNLARYDGVRFGWAKPEQADNILDVFLQTRGQGFGDEVKRRIMLGTFVLSVGYYDAYYLQAQKVRTLIRRDLEKALEKCDALLGPVCPSTAFALGEKVDDPLSMYLSDIFVTPVSVAGFCALSVPCGFAGGLPTGLQVIGKPLAEGTVMRIGRAYQSTTDWHTRAPAIPEDAEPVHRVF